MTMVYFETTDNGAVVLSVEDIFLIFQEDGENILGAFDHYTQGTERYILKEDWAEISARLKQAKNGKGFLELRHGSGDPTLVNPDAVTNIYINEKNEVTVKCARNKIYWYSSGFGNLTVKDVAAKLAEFRTVAGVVTKRPLRAISNPAASAAKPGPGK